MEETEILENQNITQAVKMKPASAQGEHKEEYLLNVSDSEDSLKQKNLSVVKNPKKQSQMENLEPIQGKEESLVETHNRTEVKENTKIESKETDKSFPKDSRELNLEETKTEVPGTKDKPNIINKASTKSIPKKPKVHSQEKLNDAATNRKLKIEEKPQIASEFLVQESQNNGKEKTKEDKQNHNKGNEESEEIPRSIPEKPEKRSLNETKDLATSKEQDTISKSEPISQNLSNEEPHHAIASTSLASQEKVEKAKEVKNAPNSIRTAEKPARKETRTQARDKIKQDMEEYFSGIQALEVKKKVTDEMNAKEAEAILKEEQRRKTWKEMVSEVGKATSLSTSTHSTASGRPPRSVVVAILQRTAKAEYKRKMTILRENYNYRLGLIKQLKHDMKNNFKSEAQQLYCNYHSIKNQTQNQPTLSDMHTVYSMPSTSQDV
ncbi:uncharacterized protein LOC108033839 [Drosophila biarmipes]|uniref:uncharacterized protein LOC108033839 n=1 Tax=Drosophila biarmipes TaxID=125945 RepID=UPI0007E81186|nr:uncharacterized protein LOC108033839 [Drosophila biarmipes]